MSRVQLEPGASLLTQSGPARVACLQRDGVRVILPSGAEEFVAYADLVAVTFEGDQIQAQHVSLVPWWQGLPSTARAEALERMEVVLELTTGFRSGHAAMAAPGEPRYPFGPGFGQSEKAQREMMSQHLSNERRPATAQTIYNWIRAWERAGLRGLVDGRRDRSVAEFNRLPEAFRAAVEEALVPFNGAASAVNISEVRRRAWVKARAAGVEWTDVPERLATEFVSHRYRALGRHPREHRSTRVRERAGWTSAPVVHPSHVCMDVTRADNLVWDPVRGMPCSVEIVTMLSVSSRVVLGCRVVAQSATATEVGLVLYDTMRPFSMLVEGTTLDDWRWAGIPQSFTLPVHERGRGHANTTPDLQGEHWVPSVQPTSIRTDHGSVFVSGHFQGLLRDFGIDFMPSRVGASTDNALIERWHETLQRGLQQIPGYKGRCSRERGRLVAEEPMLTAHELETHLHQFIALDYHRSWHQGLTLPSLPTARWSPLEYFDCLLESTGRIDVPQHPDLIYDFLPVVWLTPNHSGVEHRNLTYDSPVLDEFRLPQNGRFRAESRQIPLHVDPRDLTRLWLRHPETDRIHEVPWRGRHLIDAPMTDRMRDRAITILRAREGRPLRRDTATRQIIDVLGELTVTQTDREWSSKMTKSRLRWEQSQRDHAEAAEARAAIEGPRDQKPVAENPAPEARWDFSGPWPDLDKQGA